jgi:hypothetical protein
MECALSLEDAIKLSNAAAKYDEENNMMKKIR